MKKSIKNVEKHIDKLINERLCKIKEEYEADEDEVILQEVPKKDKKNKTEKK